MRLQTQENKTAQIVLDLLDTRNMTQSALADFFNTSVDYLMGRTLDPWPTDNTQPEEVTA